MKVTLHPCIFGYAAISVHDQYVAAIEIAPTLEQVKSSFEKSWAGYHFQYVEPFGNKMEEKVLNLINHGEESDLTPSYDDAASFFQMKVFSFLRKIPKGTVGSYQDVAHLIGHVGAARAVGTACGKNRIAILVPCHRVISANGKLGEYRWGKEIKEFLLKRELAI